MKILVFGVSGFVGNNLFEYLKKKQIEVAGVLRKDTFPSSRSQNKHNLFFLDSKTSIEDQFNMIFKDFKPDKVVNAISYFERKNNQKKINCYHEANFNIPYLILKKCIEYQSHFINLSSYWQFDDNNGLSSKNLYTASKNAFEIIFQYFLQEGTLCGCSVILHETYGENDKRDKLLNRISDAINNNKPLLLNDEENVINLTHISDVVHGISEILKLPKYEKYYEILNTEEIAVSNIINKIDEIRPIIHLILKDNRKVERRIASSQRVAFPGPPNWKPTKNLERSLLDMYKKT